MTNVLKVVVWAGVGALLFIVGLLAVSEGARVSGSIVALIGAWLLLSIKVIGPAEMAVFVLLGEPRTFCDSGLRFVPFGLARLVRYPKKMYNFDYKAREVVTRAGRYPDQDGAPVYGAQALRVDAAAYLNFSRELRRPADGEPVDDEETGTHPLIKILRAGVPVPDKELESWTEEAVVGALRVAFGQMTWRETVQDIAVVARKAEEVFREPDGALIRAGFSKKGIRLVVAEIHLPPELKAALPDVDRQRLEAEAAHFEAEERAEETGGTVVENFARLSGMSRQAVETSLRDNPEAFIRDHRQAWEEALDLTRREQAIKGRSFLDIRVQGAEGIERAFLNLLGVLQRMPPGGGGEARERRKPSPPSPPPLTEAELTKMVEEIEEEEEGK